MAATMAATMTLGKTHIVALAALAVAIGFLPAAKAQSTPPTAAPATTQQQAASSRKAASRRAARKTEAPAHMMPTAGSAHDASQTNAVAQMPSGARRDPFLPLINDRKEGGGPDHLPPGKAGLVITTVRVDGTVRSEEGMIAVLSNADQRTYFVHEGDRLYDGAVEKIGLDGVTFRQNSKDAFGKPVERVVTKRIYASAGEQQ
jgi:hypothetical protein